jgi:hypothetical protein
MAFLFSRNRGRGPADLVRSTTEMINRLTTEDPVQTKVRFLELRHAPTGVHTDPYWIDRGRHWQKPGADEEHASRLSRRYDKTAAPFAHLLASFDDGPALG